MAKGSPNLTFDIHGKVDTVARQPDRYLREVTGMRKDESLLVTAEVQEIKPEEIQQAMQLAMQIATKAMAQRIAEVHNPVTTQQPAAAAKTENTVIAETRTRQAGTYRPDYPACMITTAQAAPTEFRFSGMESVEVQTDGETISAYPTRINTISRLKQDYARDPKTGAVEPVFSTTIALDEKENEPARRRPKAPDKERKQRDYDRGSLLWRARGLAAKK
ncbi:MAG: hypothetical protein LVQ95_02485 [Candidatus Micrarchaeales archaeon]|nr:hypothetical protein [Candidatus Micrarchaeales archaeon]